MGKYVSYAGLLLILAASYIVSRNNYLLFHGFAELFSVVISSCIFIIAWISRNKTGQNHFVFLGVVYLFVGVIDFFHTLSYKGMMIFSSDIFYANQLWICARGIESISLLIFTLFIKRQFKVHANVIFVVYFSITASALLSVFYFKIFPLCFIEGQGQTQFKIVSEYIICFILFLSLGFLIKYKKSVNEKTYKYLVASIITTILSEFCFTLYTDNYGLTNVFGHLLKIISFYFIYRSIVLVSIEEPYATVFSDLNFQLAEVSRLNTKIQISETRYKQLSLQLEAILDHIPGLIFYKDKNNNFIMVNKFMAAAQEKEKSELENKSLYDLYPKEIAEKYYQDDLSVINSGKPKINIEEPWETKTGTKWVNTSKIPFVNDEGEIIGIIGISMDITDRKKAEEKIHSLLNEKELILKEVHHRLKNNLTTVHAILNLQTHTLKDPLAIKALEDTAKRVLSMSILYDKIYRSENVTAVNLADYLPSLIEHILSNFPNSGSVQTEQNIQNIVINAKTTQLLGIIINELLTNVMKYAFPDDAEGVITVTAAQKNGHVTVIIQDNGKGYPNTGNINESSGFGTMLVNLLVKEVKGRIKIEQEHGTKVTFEFDLIT